MADAFDQFELLIREQVDANVYDLSMPADDDALWQLISRAKPVDRWGRDTNNALGSAATGYFHEWRVRRNRGGAVEGATFVGNTISQIGPDSSNLLNVGQAADDLYMDPALTAERSYYSIRMALKRLMGQITANRSQIIAKLVTEPLEDLVAEKVEDALYQIRTLWTALVHANGSGAIARADGAASVLESTTTETAVAVKEGTFRRFVKGQKYQFGSYVAPASFASSASTPRRGATSVLPATRASIAYCTNTDPTNRIVYFMSAAGEGTITVTDGDYIFPYGMMNFGAANITAGSKACQGVESLLIESGNFPGTSLDVTKHRELKAHLKGDNATLEEPTPEKLAELCDQIADGGKMPPEALISERSIRTLYGQLERRAGADYQVPQGAGYSANGGVAGVGFGHMNANPTWMDSSFAAPNQVLGLAPSTWKRAMPDTIHWLAREGGMSGVSGIFQGTASGRQLSGLLQANFDVFGENGCEDPGRNFIRKGLHNYRTYNGAAS